MLKRLRMEQLDCRIENLNVGPGLRASWRLIHFLSQLPGAICMLVENLPEKYILKRLFYSVKQANASRKFVDCKLPITTRVAGLDLLEFSV